MKTVEIFLPDEDTFRAIIETAFGKFIKEAEKAGYKFDEQARSFVKDMFVSGYCYGYDDTISIISDQMNASGIIKVRNEHE